MSQVRPADSKVTMDVYAKLEQRAKRSLGINFDQLIRGARALGIGTETVLGRK